ncbi:efflux pump antibiotic resistance protein [Lentithecium fluviatile CBS 122367]|uniref:Efflux pump antibiotic resistance protein n=1 Tax=Lentithecium fluviatile CBS 122367 TaxID=1168545 RepID=A0A6G1IP56_9PLEO|nr:efflux pump antibiotic resistance protein [Lentithecium fluviatile CBS 122367]
MPSNSDPASTSFEHVSQSIAFLTTIEASTHETTKDPEEAANKEASSATSPDRRVERPTPEKSWGLALITLSLAFGTFLIALDTTIVGIAVPTITTQFHSLDDIAWYGSAYLVTLTALQPSFRRIYKLYNVKTTYLVYISISEVGSIICAAAPKSAVFIVGRAISGCGAAGLFQGALNIITNAVPLEKRPLYMGIVISVFGISACAGPVLGGAFTEDVSWRLCFWINDLIGAITFVLVLIFCKHKEEDRQPITLPQQIKQMDPIGASAMTAAICCLFLALQWGGHSKPWNSATIIGLFVGFGLILIVFCITQYKMKENATTPLRVLKQRSILFGALFLFSMAMSAYVYGYYLVIYFQSIKSSSPMKSGLQFMALALPQIVFIIIAGGVATEWSYYESRLIFRKLPFKLSLSRFIVEDLCKAKLTISREDDVPTGKCNQSVFVSAWSALGLSIGKTLFLNELTAQVARTSHISPAAVVAAGASNLQYLAPTPESLRILVEAYATAIRHALIFALVVICLPFLFTFGMEHRNIKAIAKERKS